MLHVRLRSKGAQNGKKLGGVVHLHLLEQAKMIEASTNAAAGHVIVRGITWEGYDLLDSIRDPKIWEKTKNGVEGAGGFTIDLLRDLAKGFMKKQIEEYTGLKL